jgi:hypothetical protein
VNFYDLPFFCVSDCSGNPFFSVAELDEATENKDCNGTEADLFLKLMNI